MEINWAVSAVAAAMAAAAARTDMETGKMYNAHTFAGLLFGLLLGYLQGSFFNTVLSVLVAGIVPFLFWLTGKIGGGDFKIALALGALVGAETCVFAFLFAWVAVFIVYMARNFNRGSALWFLTQNISVALSLIKVSDSERESGEEVCFGLYLFYGLFLAEILLLVVGL